jgi:hypothetical protein
VWPADPDRTAPNTTGCTHDLVGKLRDGARLREPDHAAKLSI